MNASQYTCPFCDELNNKAPFSSFENMFNAELDIDCRYVLKTENFVCAPPIGSFVEGYLLIIPKRHYLSFLSIPALYSKELFLILKLLSDFYSQYYQSNYIVFEHGSSNLNSTGGMSIFHAHLHIVPRRTRFMPAINEFRFNEYSSFFDVKQDYLSQNVKNPYLLLRDVDNRIYYCEDSGIPSQYLRKKACNIYEPADAWDWRKYPFFNVMKKTISSAQIFQLQNKYDKIIGGLYGR